MPYITKKDKDKLGIGVDASRTLFQIGENCKTAGELNYTITNIIQGYLVENRKSYQTMNDIIGALEGAKIEFYRRIVENYEDKKIALNGDVMHEDLKEE